MGTIARVKTPQFRTQLLRKLRNLFPDCDPEFQETDRGVAFRLRDRAGRYRSNSVRLYRFHQGILASTHLKRAVRDAGSPPDGLPRGL